MSKKSILVDDLDKGDDDLLINLDKSLAPEAAAVAVPEPYQPPESLWQLIKSIAPEPELDTIQDIIGMSLVEQSVELHAEVHTLLDIWRDYRHETQRALGELRRQPKLPEAPNVRDTLKKEIRMFVDQLQQQKNIDNNNSSDNKLGLTKGHNMSVINYALERKRNGGGGKAMTTSRPASGIDPATGRETPVISIGGGSTSRASSRTYMTPSRCGSSSRASSRREESVTDVPAGGGASLGVIGGDELERYVDEAKLNCEHIDEIAARLRELLEQECVTLLRDIELLQECIERECDYRMQSRNEMREPSLGELKRERKLLEETVLAAASNKVPAASTNNRRASPLDPRRMSSSGGGGGGGSNRSTPSPRPSSPAAGSVVSANKAAPTSPAASVIKLEPSVTKAKSRRNSSSSSTTAASKVAVKETITRLKKPTATPSNTLSTLRSKPTIVRANTTTDRPDSAGSSATTSSSSMSTMISRQQTTAERFRQMVLGYRKEDDVNDDNDATTN